MTFDWVVGNKFWGNTAVVWLVVLFSIVYRLRSCRGRRYLRGSYRFTWWGPPHKDIISGSAVKVVHTSTICSVWVNVMVHNSARTAQGAPPAPKKKKKTHPALRRVMIDAARICSKINGEKEFWFRFYNILVQHSSSTVRFCYFSLPNRRGCCCCCHTFLLRYLSLLLFTGGRCRPLPPLRACVWYPLYFLRARI